MDVANLTPKQRRVKQIWGMLALCICGAAVYELPYLSWSYYDAAVEFYRVSNAQMGYLMTMYGLACVISYLPAGYRYYDTKEMAVRYPFGYGLSYTTFEYSDLKLSAKEIKDTDTLTVSLKVKNTGSMAGKEIVQLYVADKTNAASRPVKELKNFAKVELAPGEEKVVAMELDKRSFAWYNTEISDWYAATGTYEILVGSSSRDILLKDAVQLTSTTKIPVKIHMNTTVAELLAEPKAKEIMSGLLKTMMANIGAGDEEGSAASEAISPEMSLKMMENSPLRTFRSFAGVSTQEVQALIEKLQAAVDQ